MNDPLVDVIIEASDWDLHLPDFEAVAHAAASAALQAGGVAEDDVTISILACDDARIADLNATFRGKPVPTNVLSWPAFPLAPSEPGLAPDLPQFEHASGRAPLGDIAISLQISLQEAKNEEKPLKNHATHLILHACLHLLGYDHETPEDADLMEGIEKKALAALGVPDPYV